MDRSIIDITGQFFTIPKEGSARPSNVPLWRHQYVYSFSEIDTAGNEQRRFYKTYKANFLNDIYMDIEGNLNYAFILLFDLLNEYDNNKDEIRLQQLLRQLAEHYPKTKTYCTSFIVKKFEENGKFVEAERIRKDENYYPYDENYYQLGTRYRDKLNLSNEDILLLNKISCPNNNFFNIEFCGNEIVKLYLSAIKRLNEKYTRDASSLDNELNSIGDLIARKHYNYRKGRGNYKYSLETIVNELYSTIFKYCENTVRENYGHKRKLNTDIQYSIADVQSEFNGKLILRLQKFLAIYAPTLELPNRSTELVLNGQNPARWRLRFDNLVKNYEGDYKQFVSDIIILGNINKRNPAVENIFYEASKFIANHDRISSLKLYIYYLHYDLKSIKFGNKPVAKTVQKTLFETNDQLHTFQVIVSNMIKDKDLDKALTELLRIYTSQRKKIVINRDAIYQVQQKHSGTVEILNEYLKDEFEDDENIFKTEEINVEEVVMEITFKSSSERVSAFIEGIDLNEAQCEILEMFIKANLAVYHHEIEIFARGKGMFKNQLIDSLNEACYPVLDDLLIEEEEDLYIINENYYQTILAK